MGTMADLLGLPQDVATVARQLFTSAIAYGIKTTAWAKGAPTRAIYRSMSEFGKTMTDAIGQTADQASILTATGEAKKVVAFQRYGITVPEATYATTTLLITNTAGGNWPWSPDAPLILSSTVTKKQYVSQGSGVIGPFDTGDDGNGRPLPVRALEPGSASTALPGDIDTWVSTVDGLTIDHPNAAIGEDEPSAAIIEAQCLARVGFVPTESTIGAGGARGAYESVARSGPDGKGGVVRPDGTRITVTWVLVVPDGSGGVIVYVSDEDGPLTSPDLALVEAAILAYANPKGVPCAVQNVTALPITCTLTIWVPASSPATDDDIKNATIVALAAYFESVPIGGYDIASGIVPLEGGISDAARDGAKAVSGVVKIAFASPSADVSIAQNERPVLDGTPTITINRVPGA